MSLSLLEEAKALYPHAHKFHLAIESRDASKVCEHLRKNSATYIQSGVAAIPASIVVTLIEQGRVGELQESAKLKLRQASLQQSLHDLYGY